MSNQQKMFGRSNGGVKTSRMGGMIVSSFFTGAYRSACANDFKLRAALVNQEFKPRTRTHLLDEEGDKLTYIFKPQGKGLFHARDTEGNFLTRKSGFGDKPIFVYDPPEPQFPSHHCPLSSDEDFSVTGDDGTTWIIGSRGNGIDIMRQEILNNTILWKEEKTPLLQWLDGDRKIPGRHSEDPGFHKEVDSYFCKRIRQGLPTTEEEIRESGLPKDTADNLICNLRNYVKYELFVE